MNKRYLSVSILFHVIIIFLLIYIPKFSPKEEMIDTIQMVEAVPSASTPDIIEKTSPPEKEKAKLEEKEEVIVPKKEKPKKERRIIEKPKPKVKPKSKPMPKVKPKLEDKLKSMLEEDKNNESEKSTSILSIKKNENPGQEQNN